MRKTIKSCEKKNSVFSALNLSIILMAAAFLIGNLTSIYEVNNSISSSCEFGCRLGNVITGHVSAQQEEMAGLSPLATIAFSIAALAVLVIVIKNTKIKKTQ